MGCEGNTYNIGMGCCQPVLAPIENYYTKYEVDKKIGGLKLQEITKEEYDALVSSGDVDLSTLYIIKNDDN